MNPFQSPATEGIFGDFVGSSVNANHLNLNPASVGFLSDVDPITRRELLAFHGAYCQEERDKSILSAYYKQEAEAEFQAAKESDSAIEMLKSLSTTSAMSIHAELRQTNEHDGSYPPEVDSIRHDGDICYFESPSNQSSIVQLDEPWILRLTVYEKILEQFQHFYNSHDAIGISSLFLFPFCDSQVIRAVNFWNRGNNHVHSNNNHIILPHYQRHYLQQPQLLPTIPDATSSTESQITLMKSVTMQGAQYIVSAFAHIFERFPDCLILFHATRVHYSNDGSLVVLRAPYTYFLKMVLPPLHHRDSINSEMQHQHSSSLCTLETSSVCSTMRMVDVELNGCIELHFSVGNIITLIRDHVFRCSANDESVSTEQILAYMGY